LRCFSRTIRVARASACTVTAFCGSEFVTRVSGKVLHRLGVLYVAVVRPTLVDLCSLYQCATRKHSYEAWFRPLRAQDDLDASRGELRKVEAALEQVEFEKSMAQRGANAMLGLSVMLLASV